jgi:hypothetical protein
VFTNHGKEDGIYPPKNEKSSKEIAKVQTKINNQRSKYKHLKNIKKDSCFQLIEDIIVLY